MWRRLQTLAPSLRRAAASSSPASARAVPLSTVPVAAFRRTSTLLSSPGDKPAPSKVEDVMPIATGLEREELEAELQGKKRFDMDPAVGPFGTKIKLVLSTSNDTIFHSSMDMALSKKDPPDTSLVTDINIVNYKVFDMCMLKLHYLKLVSNTPAVSQPYMKFVGFYAYPVLTTDIVCAFSEEM
ncbi:Cytochrome c oxidase subunit 5b-2 mitochondrial [Zea mays]|uniref:Cytochrome c oxidase subunit 5b-2 mitochondrial n=1 Tax=Zea mays TaxID=4577 RepID=A0A1D6FLB9_MAIZE|nr:Cytochrome c oxidase subunit 5b-2 mitochondrial [Zea mays]